MICAEVKRYRELERKLKIILEAEEAGFKSIRNDLFNARKAVYQEWADSLKGDAKRQFSRGGLRKPIPVEVPLSENEQERKDQVELAVIALLEVATDGLLTPVLLARVSTVSRSLGVKVANLLEKYGPKTRIGKLLRKLLRIKPQHIQDIENKVGGPFDMAIGLFRKREGSEKILNKFAERTGSKTYEDIFGSWGFRDYNQLSGRIISALEASTKIRVNLDLIVKDTDNLLEKLLSVMEKGSKGLSRDNITNWEIYQILKNPSRRSKAVFYLNGKAIKIPDGIPFKLGRNRWRP